MLATNVLATCCSGLKLSFNVTQHLWRDWSNLKRDSVGLGHLSRRVLFRIHYFRHIFTKKPNGVRSGDRAGRSIPAFLSADLERFGSSTAGYWFGNEAVIHFAENTLYWQELVDLLDQALLLYAELYGTFFTNFIFAVLYLRSSTVKLIT